ncbi:TDP-N-acetylfucosamine:lipid II N-acetylfucosaminyltransferase [Klebsiella aerogenes]|uniref:TDP-N-acetylfucosamine:lipid II N-acetylfucosaminyltransferase n=1 Tax=Klebsiella aerogenes TaxID=548 RepID=UPI001BD0F01C|nr:TDP-N-acetylfucosamine:lipid II N-acetylfucosaminyltransferase [Klebsiella aerogenes]HBQ1805935.1 TDP-N-acetylfucosamine:lipid II N-acetylfucosaminyltransferase [Klebsiella aerogenes]HCM5150078.1 TDP-N-acetylfucosamine:lipid II N-acetylfucosaminyltransferase [Klebsiella aerogenes]HDT3080939.1 TDP-N-acetylfucosamine:lipid II N-acetylfucosaminyltransferase [Klebsiella aerogenes]HDU4640154.1 TDP-N-acetylfucosamine:lipid II N-acetylfucosaminyltransferase [Klebsiella aerogenes]
MGKLRILHLCTDEKFIDRAINIFELAYPKQNFLCVYDKGLPVTHIKKDIDFYVGKRESFLGVDFRDVEAFDIVVVHSLANVWFRTIEKLSGKLPIVWLGWGYDYYDLMGGERKWLLQETFTLNRKITKNRNLKQRIKNLILYPNFRRNRIIGKINYFSPVIPGEYDLIKKNRKWKRFPEQVDWNYGAAEKDLSSYVSDINDISSIGENILIGNSATSTNNHLEIFNILSKINFQERKLIVPLNYGNRVYGQKINVIAYDLLGESVDALIDFMPLEEYMRKISSCGFVIMNHIRQQGVGNIISMIYFGAKVFLRLENPTFSFLKEKGIKLYSVQELENEPSLLSSHLEKKDVVNNRLIIDSIWSNMVLLNKTIKLVSYVTKKEGKGEA